MMAGVNDNNLVANGLKEDPGNVVCSVPYHFNFSYK
jgi:hypothetical protein